MNELQSMQESLESIQERYNQLNNVLENKATVAEIIYLETNISSIHDKYNQIEMELRDKVEQSEITNLRTNISILASNVTNVHNALNKMETSEDGAVLPYKEELSNQIHQMENLRQDMNLMQVSPIV